MPFKPMFKAGCCGSLSEATLKLPRSLWADRGGVTSVEYALLASLLALAVLTGGATVGTGLQGAFSAVSQSLAACRSEVASVFACLGQSCVVGWR